MASFEYLQMMIGKLFKGGFAALQWNHDIVFRPCQQHRTTDFVLEGPNPPLSHNTSALTRSGYRCVYRIAVAAPMELPSNVTDFED